ncbi:TPA: hypothetical protein DEX28_00215 [Patescibacteria group bacterium]|uniref:Dihydroorotate oxidase n=2 Tax=Candidatus Woeseibacteriota TaxID=1752722 RepID=A0A0G1GGD5_9BACT|nr:MAG: Dihydroorotate dehydrogenase (quinone) [Candidatus Woesebacteria bacterium GW2011_GWB1_44_11b]HCI05156.1 hypothetical protein [Patescibacteria group bacterium]
MFRFLYKNFLKPVLFLFDAEFVHENMLGLGELIGKFGINPDGKSGLRQNRRRKNLLSLFFGKKYPELKQNIFGIELESPIGLAAGFDYKAKLTQVLPSLGFGFQTVGTITNQPCEGNQKPRLGRLPKSRSLMVNKGFKNKGAEKISKKLAGLNFSNAIGVSIGVTNTEKIKTEEQGIKDIVSAFLKFSASHSAFHYFELNISCPNLKTKIDFYPHTYNQGTKSTDEVQFEGKFLNGNSSNKGIGVGVNPLENLKKLLVAIKKLELNKPVFVKMPINLSDSEVLAVLKIITEAKMAGVIFGNLQKGRSNEFFDKNELKKFPVGNFSGKPTEKRSNELIKLAYQNFGNKLVVIGCGGVFSAEDAYKKIKLGASLVQLITGLVFEGPQLVSEINRDLVKLLKEDGFKNISEAIGAESRI